MDIAKSHLFFRQQLSKTIFCLLLAYIFVPHSDASMPPVYFAVAGEKASIPCNVTAPLADDQVSLILWYRLDLPNPIYTLDVRKVPIKKARHFPSEEMGDRAYFNINDHPPVLVLTPARIQDEAEYRCRVDLRKSRTLILHARLKIIVPPSEPIIMDEHGQRLRDIIGPYDEGAFLTLACEVDGGYPSPEVTWWRGTTLLDDGFNVTPQGFVRNELYLLELQRSDLMAEFTCQASNTNLSKPRTSAVTLDLNLKPLEVKIAVIHHPLFAGVRKLMICETTGSRPRAILSWWREGDKLGNGIETVSDGGNLTVSSITFVPKPEDNGKMLACRAENPSLLNSAITDEWIIRVNYAPIMTLSFGPSISHSGIKEGTDIYLECTIHANPWITEIIWKFEDKIISSNMTAGIIVSNQTLVIQKVKKHHRGKYKCLSSNSLGKGESEYLHLQVQFSPMCLTKTPKLYGISKDEVVKVVCEVEANPAEVSFRWSLNNTVEILPLQDWLVEGSKSVLTYSPMTMIGYGMLLCWARNEVGEQQEPCVSRVIPAGAPESPRGCAVTNHTRYRLTVECEAGYDGGLPQTFHLELYNSAVEHITMNLTSKESPVFTARGLPPGTTFVIVLYSSNAKGKSNSVALMATTLSHKHNQNEESHLPINLFVGTLIGVVSAIVVVAIATIALIRLRCPKNRSKDGATKDEELRCEIPLKKDLDELQDNGSKGPDIIPFSVETEVYFSTEQDDYLSHRSPSQEEFSAPEVFLKKMNRDTAL